jgi:hypothetical protein
MGTAYPPHDKQRRPPSLWADEPVDDARSLVVEDVVRADEPALWGDEHTDDVHALREENARLRELLVQRHSAATSRADGSLSTPTPPCGSGRTDPTRNHEQLREFCQFLAHEWRGNRHHSYAVPSRGRSSAWSRTVDGKWSAVGLADAVSKYDWSGRSFSENKAELDRFAADLQSAIRRDSNKDVCAILQAIMHRGGVGNKYRQRRTFEWIERNADEISARLSQAVDLIKDEGASLDPFDGVNLIMNSTMAKIVSIADPEQKLVIYDGRVGGALGFFVARFTEEREIHQYDVADQLLFAVDREAKRTPETNRIHFPALFGKARDRCHASMMRWASQLIWQVAKECRASPKEIEAALFMWGYNVAEEPED